MISTAPYSSAFSALCAPSSARLEQITTGIGCCAMIFCRKVRPSMRGISMSSVITSGTCSRILSAATKGSEAVAITSIAGSEESTSLKVWRTSGGIVDDQNVNFRRTHRSVFPIPLLCAAGSEAIWARRWSSTSPVPVWNWMVRPTSPPKSVTSTVRFSCRKVARALSPFCRPTVCRKRPARSHGQRVRSAKHFDLYLRSGRAQGFQLPGQFTNGEIDIAVALRRPHPSRTSRQDSMAKRAQPQARAPERHPHTRAQNGLQDRRGARQVDLSGLQIHLRQSRFNGGHGCRPSLSAFR